jgi:hypothetical protein
MRRRPRQLDDGSMDLRDEDGLSLCLAAEIQPRTLVESFGRCFGVVSLHLGRLFDLGLEVVTDPLDDKKVLVKNLPFERDPDGEKLAGDVAKLSRVVMTCNHRHQ